MDRSVDFAEELGLTPVDLLDRASRIDQMMAGAVRQGDPAKAALNALAADLSRSPEDIARIVARTETGAKRASTIKLRLGPLDQIETWRKRLP